MANSSTPTTISPRLTTNNPLRKTPIRSRTRVTRRPFGADSSAAGSAGGTIESRKKAVNALPNTAPVTGEIYAGAGTRRPDTAEGMTDEITSQHRRRDTNTGD